MNLSTNQRLCFKPIVFRYHVGLQAQPRLRQHVCVADQY
jgi:hypothetical protein